MKVVFKEISFNVNEEKKTVACIMTGYVALKSSQKVIVPECVEWVATECDIRVVGVARCHPGDDFDEAVGKRVAESKAKRLLYSEGATRLKLLVRHTKIFQEDLERGIANLETYKEAESKHIKKLTGTED